jgi:hypothetical protein
MALLVAAQAQVCVCLPAVVRADGVVLMCAAPCCPDAVVRDPSHNALLGFAALGQRHRDDDRR